jgi:hypothetical protein
VPRTLHVGQLLIVLVLLISPISSSRAADTPSELHGAFRLPEKSGWTYVHLQGSPHEIGFQNGYLLAPEIADMLKVVMLESKHDYKKDWPFFRDAAQNMMWPHIEQEYRDELQGIADGASAHGVKIDVWDVVGLNAETEWGYYNAQYDKEPAPRQMRGPCLSIAARLLRQAATRKIARS